MGTKRRIVDEIKFDVALPAQSIASTNVTGDYFDMKNWRKALFHLSFGAMVAAGTIKLEVFQAKDRAGTGTVLITSASAINALLTGMQVGKVTLSTFLATQTITVTTNVYSGSSVVSTAYVFTAHATVTTLASRQFSISGADTADGDELVKCLNDSTYGVPGTFAVNAAGAVTIYCIDDKTTITLASNPDDGTDVKATVKGNLIVEVDKAAMAVPTGFTWLAAKVTTASATVLCSVMLARFGRFNPAQQTMLAPVSV